MRCATCSRDSARASLPGSGGADARVLAPHTPARLVGREFGEQVGERARAEVRMQRLTRLVKALVEHPVHAVAHGVGGVGALVEPEEGSLFVLDGVEHIEQRNRGRVARERRTASCGHCRIRTASG